TLGRERERAARVRSADGPAGARREPDEVRLGSALDARTHVREVAGEPEELQLKGERERVDGVRRLDPDRPAVEEVEEPRQRLERRRLRLGLGVEPQHRLGADEADPEAVRLLSHLAVRPEQLDARHGRELTRPAMEEELDVRERLEPPAEARLRLADALRDRAEPAA